MDDKELTQMRALLDGARCVEAIADQLYEALVFVIQSELPGAAVKSDYVNTKVAEACKSYMAWKCGATEASNEI